MKVLLVIYTLCLLLSVSSCCCTSDCSRRGQTTLAFADFENGIGLQIPQQPTQPPTATTSGASLNVDGPASSVGVVNSDCLGSNALRAERGNNYILIEVNLGDKQFIPFDGKVYFDFEACGEVIPQYLISSTTIWVESLYDDSAFYLKLFDGAYQLYEDEAYIRLEGNYDPSESHHVHIEVNLDSGVYTICINDKVVANRKSFCDAGFSNCYALKISIPAKVTEGFENVYVIDNIRITR